MLGPKSLYVICSIARAFLSKALSKSRIICSFFCAVSVDLVPIQFFPFASFDDLIFSPSLVGFMSSDLGARLAIRAQPIRLLLVAMKKFKRSEEDHSARRAHFMALAHRHYLPTMSTKVRLGLDFFAFL
jgi:hypothetical protein